MRIRTLDMGRADGYAICEFDILKEALQREGKYLPNPQLLYRGFDADNIPLILETGQDTIDSTIFCAVEEEITAAYPTGYANIFDYAGENQKPAIAVFSTEHLIELENDPLGVYAYKFKNPDKKLEGLVAVYKLKYPRN